MNLIVAGDALALSEFLVGEVKDKKYGVWIAEHLTIVKAKTFFQVDGCDKCFCSSLAPYQVPNGKAKNRTGSHEELTSFDRKLIGPKPYHAPQESYRRKPRYPSGGDHYTVREISSERSRTAFHN
ncbi:hypothetical protein [Pseudomonas sp. R151218B TE3479]